MNVWNGEVNVARNERVISAAAGAALVGLGAWRRGVLGILSGVAGAALLVRGASGHCSVYQAMGVNTARKEQEEEEATHALPGKVVEPAALDPIDEAAIASFPASDPPSFTGSKATPGSL